MSKQFFKHAFRSLFRRPFTSALYIFVLLCSSILFLLLISTSSIMYYALKHNSITTYGEMDLKIELGNNYEQRFFSLDPLLKSEIKEEIKDIVPILSVPTVTNEQENIIIYFTDLNEFKKMVALPELKIAYQEAILVGDLKDCDGFISVNVYREIRDFEILAQVKPNGLLKDSKTPILIVDRSLADSLTGLPAFKSMYNIVYLNLFNHEKIDQIQSELIKLYPNQVSKKTIDYNEINKYTKRYSVLINVIAFLAIIPLSFTLLLLAKVNFKNNENELLILKTIGASPRQSYLFFLLEYIFYLLSGFILAIPCWIIINKFMTSYITGVKIFVLANWPVSISISFLLVFLYLLLFYTFSYNKLTKQTHREAEATINTKYYQIPSFKQQIAYLVSFSAAVFCYFVIFIFIIPRLSPSLTVHFWTGIISFVLALIIIYLLIKIILSFIPLVFKKKTSFFFLETRTIAYQKLTFTFYLMAIFAILTVSFSLFVNNNFTTRLNEVQDALNFDLFISNITIKHDEYDNLTSIYEEIEWLEKGYFYANIKIIDYDVQIPLLYSFDMNEVEKFSEFQLSLTEYAIMNDEENLAILLPVSLQKIYGLKQGDYIKLELDSNQGFLEFQVAGFIDINHGVYAFTNLYQNSNKISDHEFNAVYIKTDDINYVAKDIIKKFSGSGVIVNELEQVFLFVKARINFNNQFFSLFVYIISFSLFCLLLCLFIFILFVRKESFDLLFVLGYRPNYSLVIKKTFIVSMIILIISFFGSIVLTPSLKILIMRAERYFAIKSMNSMLLLIQVIFMVTIFLMHTWEWLLIKRHKIFAHR